jgi:plastocyanin
MSMKTRTILRPWIVAVLAVVAVAVLAACGGGTGYGGGSDATAQASTPASPAAGGSVTTNEIAIQNFSFTPAQTTVKAGTAVTWTNNDSTTHDVTSTDGAGTDAATTSAFASKPLAQGDTFSFTFDKPGTYYYECTIHASMATMHAVVIVE